jgi:hypothetical protein
MLKWLEERKICKFVNSFFAYKHLDAAGCWMGEKGGGRAVGRESVKLRAARKGNMVHFISSCFFIFHLVVSAQHDVAGRAGC